MLLLLVGSYRKVIEAIQHMTTALRIGDPGKEAATSSRFVLPFAYSLRRATAKKGPCLVPEQPSDSSAYAERIAYLTPETAYVLHSRALWLRANDVWAGAAGSWAFGPMNLKINGRDVGVRIDAPRVVLFEAYDARGGIRAPSSAEDPLLMGFIILDVWFPTKISVDGKIIGNALRIEDLCRFNEMFRYWRRPFPGHGSLPSDKPHVDGVLGVESHSGGADRYSHRWLSVLRMQVKLGESTYDLMPDAWHDHARYWVSGCAEGSGGSLDGVNRNDTSRLRSTGWVSYTDARAFVWSAAVKADEDSSKNGGLVSDANWLCLLNVDGKPRKSPTEFEKAWVDRHTYRRWQSYGSLYGVCTHGGACSIPGRTEPPLWRHFGDLYFDQTLLLLYLRVALFTFSRRVTELSARSRISIGIAPSQWEAEFSEVRGRFAQFANLYQYPLISSQQQGVELYEIARRAMDVEVLMTELSEQIDATHDWLQVQHGRQLNATALYGLAFGLAIGVFGMNFVGPKDVAKAAESGSNALWWSTFAVLLLASPLILIAFSRVVEWGRSWGRTG